MKRYIWVLSPVLFLFIGCGNMTTVTMPVMRPAPLHVGNHIQTVAVIDRITPEHELLSRVESLLTGGGMPGLDKEAAQRSIDGLVHTLQQSPRFEVIRTAESFRTPILRGNWPEPLRWRQVEALCEEYNCDAIISLETFNSDFLVTDGTRVVTRKDDDGNEREVTEYYAEGVANVKLGFRLYDPANRSIVDAHMFDHGASWSASGSTLQDAMAALMNHRQAVINTSFDSGKIYAERISPQWMTVRRQFFRKGGDDTFMVGVRRAQVNDWSGAMDAWYESVNSSDVKTAGRSAYNLALMYEIEGELDMAREWAQIAYTDYDVSRARRYVSTIERRMAQQERADAQLR